MFGFLIVEDDSQIRNSLCRDFSWDSWGFRLLGSASNGKAALEMVDRLNPDAVITDIRMPEMDGLTLLKNLRQRSNPPEVILLSAYDDFRYAQKGIESGAFSYVLKVEVFDEIEETMKRLNKHLSAKPSRLQPDESEALQSSSDAIQNVLAYLPEHLGESPTLTELAEKFGFSANYMSQRFRQETGITFGAYIKKLRLERAKELLSSSTLSLEKIAQDTGFQSVQYFHRFFHSEVGMTPIQFRKSCKSMANELFFEKF